MVRLRASGLTKSFGAIQALKHADFELRPGEVMALVGENGAGKSTFVKILCGIHRRSAGDIEIDGQPCELGTTARSAAAGIAVVQQELSIVPTLSVAENLRLGGDRATRRSMTDGRMRDTLALVGLDHLEPASDSAGLTIAEQQMLEIARVILRDASIILLDEPTAALSDDDIERVHAVVRRLVEDGRSVIYITHRLGEIAQLADRITVFKDGESQPPLDVSSVTTDEIIARMLGREMERMFPDRPAAPVGSHVVIRDFMTEGVVSPVDLTAAAGEIVGLAGQIGSGAQELLRGLAGSQPATGSISIGGESVVAHSPRSALGVGIAYCSGDRKHDGFFGQREVFETISAPGLDMVTPLGILNRGAEKRLGRAVAAQVGFDPTRLRNRVATLSGGNQQKVVLGKWIAVGPRLFLIDEPTRGVDVGARAEIYETLRRLASEGLTVIFASSEIHEVQGLADTVVTFFRGRPVASYDADAVDHATLVRDITTPQEEPVR